MNILVALVIGMAVGAAGQYMLQKELDTLMMSFIAGIAGSMLGLVTYVVLDFDTATTSLFNVRQLLFCCLGALVSVFAFSALHKIMEKHTEPDVETSEMETKSKVQKNPEEEKERT